MDTVTARGRRRRVLLAVGLFVAAVAVLVAATGGVAATPDAGATNDTVGTESVQGADDRTRVDPTTAWPRRATGHVFMEYPNGNTGVCSAATISETVILTAAHCVYNSTTNEWANETLVFRPARHNASTAPYGSADWTHIVTYKNWTDSGNNDYDVAIVQLDRPIGKVVGYMGRVAAPSNHPLYSGWVNLNQYPADKPFGTMWFDSNKTGTSLTGDGKHIRHNADTAGGSSGSALYKYYSGNGGCPPWASCPGRYTAGVHTYAGNFANRLTPSKFADIEYWMNTVVDESLVDDNADLVDDGPRWTDLDDSTVSPGGSVGVSHDVRNIGTSRVSNSRASGSGADFTVEYYLSTLDDGVDSFDTKVDERTVSADVAPFDYANVDTDVDIPSDTIEDDYYVCYEIDADAEVTEFDTDNNDACTDEQVTVSSTTTEAVETDGATVYVGSNDTSLYAVDADTGQAAWTFTEPAGQVIGSPTVVDGTVYVGTGVAETDTPGALYAIDADTGDKEWEFTVTDRVFTSSPTVVDGTIYLGGTEANESQSLGEGNGELYAVDAATGQKQWEYTDTRGAVISSPNVDDGTVYVGSFNATAQNGTLHAVDAGTGQQEWVYSGPNSFVFSSPTVHDGTVYVASDGVYAVDAATGAEEWSFVDVSFIDSSPTVANGSVFVGTWDETVYAFDAATGTPEWSFHEPSGIVSSSPTYSNGTVYVGSDDTALYAVDAASGTQEWRFNGSTDYVRSSPTVRDGTVFVGSNDGNLYAVDASSGQEAWSYSGVGEIGVSSPTVVADPAGGDSVGTRVALRTLGHHNESTTDGGTQVDKSQLTYLQQVAKSPWATPPTGNVDPVDPPPFAPFSGTATRGIAIDENGNVQTFQLPGQRITAAAPGDEGLLENRDAIADDGSTDRSGTTGFVGLGVPQYANDDGVVDNDGLRTAVDDWRVQNTSTVTLRDTVDVWRTGETVTVG